MPTLEGTIDKVRYFKSDTGYTVASLYIDYSQRKKIPEDYYFGEPTLTIVGIFDRKPIEEEEVILEGDFIVDKKFGFQFKFSSFKRKNIDSKLGLINFFSSDLFPGIGLSKAKLIVDTLGLKAVELIRQDKKVLDTIKLTPNEKETIYSTIIKDFDNENNMLFLLNHGLSLPMAKKIINLFDSENLVSILSKNPYILIDKIERFGFQKADNLAFSLGLEKNNPYRLQALLLYSLNKAIYNSGNSYISRDDLFTLIQEIVNDDITYKNYEDILNTLIEEKKIIIDENNNIFDYYFYQQEIELAMEITRRIKDYSSNKKIGKYNKKKIEEAFDFIEESNPFEFSLEQKEAIKKAFTSPIMIITGGPGTGKTTIVHAIIKMYLLLNDNDENLIRYISLLAPTGRAAKRMNETTNMDASTIHRYLGYDGEGHFEYNKYNKTNSRLIIVDEASMMDLDLAYRLFTSASNFARIIIVGDVDQLPSVGPGQVLSDLINTKLIETVYLNTIHRQANDSSIINLAHDVNLGYLPEDILEKKKDRNFIPTDDEHLPQLICDLALGALKKGKELADVQILIPMYRGNCGINNINKLIQEKINPLKEDDVEIISGINRFRVGDKVIQLINRVEKNVMNGDIGYITSIQKDGKVLKEMLVAFDTLIVSYNEEELEDLSLAYAVSIHKAQGSEFEVVILPFTNQYYVMLKKKLIYTAITRAKSTLLLIGNPNSLAYGIHHIEVERKTILKKKILEYMDYETIDEAIERMVKDKTTNQIEEEYEDYEQYLDSLDSLEESNDISDLVEELDLNEEKETNKIGEKEYKI